ncbi:MAG: dihydrofolate reductase [Myxococcota bacterium]
MKPLGLIVAMARNRCIGKDGTLPWRIPEDLRYFRRVTLGHAVIMGRKTFDSIGKPLQRRHNLVVSRQPDLTIDGAEVCPSVERALERAYELDDAPLVIGGAGIYEAALPLTTRIYLTEVDRDVDGDTFFPELTGRWTETERRPGEERGYSFVVLERVREPSDVKAEGLEPKNA